MQSAGVLRSIMTQGEDWRQSASAARMSLQDDGIAFLWKNEWVFNNNNNNNAMLKSLSHDALSSAIAIIR